MYSYEEEDVFDQRLDDDLEGREEDEEGFLDQPPQGEYQVRQGILNICSGIPHKILRHLLVKKMQATKGLNVLKYIIFLAKLNVFVSFI